MWDSRFFIEVYSRLCQVLGQCRWAEKANEKRKKHESSEKVSEQKTAGREKGRACSILLNTSICPLPRPPRVIFQDRPALKELYDMSPNVLGRRFLEFLCLQQNSFYRAVRFANSEDFPNHSVICRKNETENNSWLFKIAKEIAMVFLSREGGRLWLLQVRPKKTFPGLSTSHVIKYWELIRQMTSFVPKMLADSDRRM